MNDPFTPTFFRHLQQLQISSRRTYLGSRQGIHLSARRGHGIEFADYRPYVPGDDFRHIDWRSYARTDRLFVREYREEQDLNVLVLLDSSKSMRFPEEEDKEDFARYLCLALAYVALVGGDRVVVSLLGMRRTPHYRNPKSFARLRRALESWVPDSEIDLNYEVNSTIHQERSSGRAFLISDLYVTPETLRNTLGSLRARNFDVSVFHILSPSEVDLKLPLDASEAVDAETGQRLHIGLSGASVKEYARLLAMHVHSLEEVCRSTESAYVLCSSDQNLQSLVLHRLPELNVLK